MLFNFLMMLISVYECSPGEYKFPWSNWAITYWGTWCVKQFRYVTWSNVTVPVLTWLLMNRNNFTMPAKRNLSLFDFVLQASPGNLFVALPLIWVHPSWSILLQKHYAFYLDIDLIWGLAYNCTNLLKLYRIFNAKLI